MDLEKLDFHVASRKPFAGEEPVLAAVKRAQTEIATISGAVQGGALFRILSHVSAKPTVIPQAVDIVRGGVEQAIARNADVLREYQTAVEKAIAAQNDLARKFGDHEKSVHAVGKQAMSGIDEAHAKIAASLARLNA